MGVWVSTDSNFKTILTKSERLSAKKGYGVGL